MQSTSHVIVPHDTDAATSDQTLRQLAGGFVAGKRSPWTRQGYATDLRMYFRWCRAEGYDPIIGISRTHLELYARHMEARDLAPGTRARRIGVTRGWYEWLIDEGHFDQPNPVRKVVQPRATPVRPRPALTKRQMNDLLHAAEAEHATSWGLVALGYINGLRISEICGTNVDDVGRNGWHHTLRILGKGEKHDEVTLWPAALAACAAAAEYRGPGDPTDDHGDPLLVSQETGRRLTRKNAATILARLCRDNQLTRITPHGLRRTAITIAFQEGVHPSQIQDFARHANPQTTMVYNRRARSLDEHIGSTLLRAVA